MAAPSGSKTDGTCYPERGTGETDNPIVLVDSVSIRRLTALCSPHPTGAAVVHPLVEYAALRPHPMGGAVVNPLVE